MISQFADMTSSSNSFVVDVFPLSSSVTGPSFMSISRLVLELWQLLVIKEIRKSEIPPSEFCSISGDWGVLGIANFARMSLIKSYWILQNARFTAFIVSELIRESQQGRGGITPSTISSNHENCCIKLNSHLSENFHFLMKLPLSNFFWNLCTFHIIFEFHLGISFFLFHFFCWNKVNRIWSI